MESDTSKRKDVIYVTGFGPFPPYSQNASQLAVEKLKYYELEKKLDVKLEIDIVHVEYQFVQNFIPKRWAELKPKLVIHVGVSGRAKTLTLEKQAHNSAYERNDIHQCLPSNKLCVSGGSDILITKLCLDSVKDEINKLKDEYLPCSISTDPGKYLCDFIYYTSLNEDSCRTLFIHIPDIDEASTDLVAKTLAQVICILYKQLEE